MTDQQERTVEETEPETGAEQPDTNSQQTESFLAVESALATHVDGETVWGRAVDVERIPASEVPAEYPRTITTDRALVLHIAIDGEDDHETRCYFEWDDTDAEDRLSRLLALYDVPLDRFGDLYGQRIFLEIQDGYYIPYVPSTPPRGSPQAVYGVAGGLVFNLLSVGLLLAVGGSVVSVPTVLLWFVVNFVGLPLSTYLDAWHTYTHTDWEGGPLFWAFLALLPIVNVLTTALYLQQRRTSTSLA